MLFIFEITQVNWTSHVNGLESVGTNQLIAHFKIADFQLALFADIRVDPKTGACSKHSFTAL